MDNSIRLAFCIASRADKGQVQPLLKRLKDNPKFDLLVIDLIPFAFADAIDTIQRVRMTYKKPIQAAICPFDRVEMYGAASAFFLAQIPVIQLHAGDMSVGGTHDDVLRHAITMLSSIQFCNGSNSLNRVRMLLLATGKPVDKCFEVGSIQFDDLEIDESLVPNEPFDLVLYNPPTRRLSAIEDELDQLEKVLSSDRKTLWIVPCEDEGRGTILKRMDRLEESGTIVTYGSLDRPLYFGLLKNAYRCIGNSSSFFIELPFFHKYHIHIGCRNLRRERVEPNTGGSDRIITHLEELLFNHV